MLEMAKKIIIVLFAASAMVFVFRLSSTLAQRNDRGSEYAQKYDFTLLEEKIDKILNMLPERGRQEQVNREISAKLDQVLANQQRILSELDVVKVRATRK